MLDKDVKLDATNKIGVQKEIVAPTRQERDEEVAASIFENKPEESTSGKSIVKSAKSNEEVTTSQNEEQTKAKEARLATQHRTVEEERIKAYINKALQDKGIESNTESFIAMAIEMKNSLVEKKESELTKQDRLQLEILNDIIGVDDSVELKSVEVISPKSSDMLQEEPGDSHIVSLEEVLLGNSGIANGNALENLADLYLKKHDKNYATLDDKNKRSQRRQVLEDLLHAVTNDKNKNKYKATMGELAKVSEALIMLDYSKEDISIAEFTKLDFETRKEMIYKFEGQAIEHIMEKYTKDIPKEELDKMTSDAKLYACIDNFLASSNPEYKNLNDEQKANARLKFIDNILGDKLGVKEWAKLDSDKKGNLIRQFARDIDMSRTLKIPISEIIGMEPMQKIELLKQYVEQTKTTEINPNEQVLFNIMEEKSVKSYGEIENELKSYLSDPNITAKEKENYRQALEYLQQIKDLSGVKNSTILDITAEKFANEAAATGHNVKTYIQNMLDQGGVSNKDLRGMLAWASKNPQELEFVEDQLRLHGYSPEQISKYKEFISSQTIARNMINAGQRHDTDAFCLQIDLSKESNNDMVAKRAATIQGHYFNGKAYDTVTEHEFKVFGKEISPYIAKSMTDRGQMSYEEAQTHYNHLAQSSNVAPDVKKEFTKDWISECGKNGAEEQKLAYKAAVDTGNYDCLEGAAAAEKSLDKSIKDECSAYLDNELNSGNYTSEQKANIQTARETGQTSAQIETSNQSNKPSSSTNSTSGSSTPRSTTNPAGATSSSSAQSSSTKAAAAKAQAQVSADYARQITEALKLKKEQALERISNIVENYQKDVKAREEKKAQEAKKEAEKTASASAASKSSSSSATDKKSTDEIAEKYTNPENITESISAEKVEELKQAYKSGGAVSLYDKLGTVSTNYQAQFLNYFGEHANTADLCAFASAHSGNKNIILTLYQRSNDPALLQYLGESNAFELLGKGKIKLRDFLRFASPDMVAKYMRQLHQVGNTQALKQVADMMTLTQREEISQDIIAQAEQKKPVPGSDEWMRANLQRMESASNNFGVSSTKVGSKKFDGGRTRQNIHPWDIDYA